MGKRIPTGRKHKKLKSVDPCYTGGPPVRGKKKVMQWNEPPMAEDEQGASRPMEEFIEAKNNAKRKKPRRKKKKVIKDDYIIVRNEIVDKMEDTGEKGASKRVPGVLRQKSYESSEQFLGRLQRMGELAFAEAKVEEKYNVEVVSVDKDGNAKYRPAPNITVDEPLAPVNNTREKRKKRKEKQQEKKRLKTDDKEFDLKKESIQFGEVVHAPPTFKAKPRKAPSLNKAGSRNLALNDLLPHKVTEKKVTPLSSTKWKALPNDKRKVIENERQRAVQMYRTLKTKKIS